MPMPPEQLETFLRRPEIAVLATVGVGERPHAVPVWFLWEDGVAYFTTSRRAKKWRNIERNTRVALCINGATPPHPAAIIEGTAAEAETPYGPLLRRIAQHYLGVAEGQRWFEALGPNPGTGSVAVRITPERILSWGTATDE